jgi:methylmalonyl-CoA mutase cobalamin-binding domain/chain
MPNIHEITRQLVEALLRLDSAGVNALLAGLTPREGGPFSLDDVVVPALEQIGQAWEEGRVALSQVYMAGRICERALSEVLPADRPLRGGRPRLAIGVLQDHHALGKRMVKSALHSAGYHVLDFGHGRTAAELVELALRDEIDVLLISCLMLASAVQAAKVVDGLRRAGSSALVVLGGAPFRLSPQLWREVGASAMGRNSADAVGIVQTLAEGKTWA